jgi:class 3 adenylate cyclase
VEGRNATGPGEQIDDIQVGHDEVGTNACGLARGGTGCSWLAGGVNALRTAAGASEIRCGIARHAGDVMYGNGGSVRRLAFTATGPAVNEVCCLDARCNTLVVPLVISDVAASLYDSPLQSLGWYELRGVGRTIEAFSLPEYKT